MLKYIVVQNPAFTSIAEIEQRQRIEKGDVLLNENGSAYIVADSGRMLGIASCIFTTLGELRCINVKWKKTTATITVEG